MGGDNGLNWWLCGNCDERVDAGDCCRCCGYDQADSQRIQAILDRRIRRLAQEIVLDACGVLIGYLRSKDAFACRAVGRGLQLVREKFGGGGEEAEGE